MNSLFIGLGGAGTYALAELQKKIEVYDRTSNTESVNSFLYIDTDKAVLNTYPFIKDGDFFQLGRGVVPDEVMRDVDNKSKQVAIPRKYVRFKEWIDTFNPGLRGPHDLTTGAAGNRMLTRMAIWKQAGDGDFQRIIDGKLRLPNGSNAQRVYVVSGTAGGTGCGSVIDILFMLQKSFLQIADARNNIRPTINLMLVMPEGYIENYKPGDPRLRNYPLNAYGLFAELNACLKDYWSNVKYKTNAAGEWLDENGNVTTDSNRAAQIVSPIRGKQWAKHSVLPLENNDVNNLDFLPFNTAYMFDSHSGTEPIDYGVISERIASFMFNLEVGTTVRTGLESVFSNVLIDNAIASAASPYVKAFNATGTFTIQTFEELRKRYVKDKFIYQMIVHGFVGKDTDFVEYQGDGNTDTVLWERLRPLIEDYTSDAWTRIRSTYENADGQTLLGLLNKIESRCKDKKPAFGQIFDQIGSRGLVTSKYEALCDSIRDCVLNRCGEWIVTYNIKHATSLVGIEDNVAELKCAEKQQEIKKQVPKAGFFTKIKNRFAGINDYWTKLEEAFKLYVEIMINRYLSNDGVFDECRDMLTGILNKINIEEFEIVPNSKRKLVKWEDYFIKELIELPNDPTRKFTKDTKTLLTGVYLSKNCDFPQKYAEIVRQSEDKKTPEMIYVQPDGETLQTEEGTLLWYKEKIVRAMGLDSERYRPDVLENNVSYILETIVKQTQLEANEIIFNNDSLKEPIKDQLNSDAARNRWATELINARDTFFNTRSTETHPRKAIYLGHFEENGPGAQMEAAIRGDKGFDQNVDSFTNDPAGYWDDRYVKVFVDMSYSLDEYWFFSSYEEIFQSYYADNQNNWARHQPFSSRQFWECENADIVALFNKGAEETRIQQMQEQLQWNQSEQFYAFGFMLVLLNEYYKRLLSLQDSKAFLEKFQPMVKGKKKIKPINFDSKNVATLTYSSDYMYNPNRSEYRVDDSDGCVTVNLGVKNIDGLVDDIKDKYHRFVQYWMKIIDDARKSQSISNETKLYQTAFAEIVEIANKRAEGAVFNRLIEPYYNGQTQTKGERDFFEEYQLWFSK